MPLVSHLKAVSNPLSRQLCGSLAKKQRCALCPGPAMPPGDFECPGCWQSCSTEWGRPDQEPSVWGEATKDWAVQNACPREGVRRGCWGNTWGKSQRSLHLLFQEEDISEDRIGWAQPTPQGCHDLWPRKHNRRSTITPPHFCDKGEDP